MAYNELYNDQRRYIISGWVSWSWYWLLYDVSSIEYFFDWLKTSLQTQVTLNNWDTNYNRFDAITVDEYGTIYLIEWIPEENPLIPIIPDDQILVQYILVEANTTEPNIIQDAIYLDNGEWATSTYTSWSTWSSIDFNNSSIVKQGTLSVFGNTDKLMWARFVRTTAIDAQMFTVITMWVYLPTVIPTTRSLNVRFENSAWALVGNTVNLFSYWVNKSIAWQRQLAIVPISVFWAITNVKWLKILLAWWTNLVYNEWYIDYIMLSWGIPPQANVPTITVAKNGVNVGTQSTINLIEWVWVSMDTTNNPAFNRVDIELSSLIAPVNIYTNDWTLSWTRVVAQNDSWLSFEFILWTNSASIRNEPWFTGILASSDLLWTWDISDILFSTNNWFSYSNTSSTKPYFSIMAENVTSANWLDYQLNYYNSRWSWNTYVSQEMVANDDTLLWASPSYNRFTTTDNLSWVPVSNMFTIYAESLQSTAYPNTRDDSVITTPINFIYTDNSGKFLSAPLTSIIPTKTTDEDPTFTWTLFSLLHTPSFIYWVYVNWVYQNEWADYTVSWVDITFTSTIASSYVTVVYEYL